MAELSGILGCGLGLTALVIGWRILHSLQTNVRELRMEVDQLHRWSQRLLMSSLNAGRYAPSFPSERSSGLRISEITEIVSTKDTAPSIAPAALDRCAREKAIAQGLEPASASRRTVGSRNFR